MIPYFIVYLLILSFSILGALTRQNFFLFLIFFVLTIFSGFRYYIGVDYINYVYIYEGVDGYGSKELGFNLLLDFLHWMGATAQSLFLIFSIIMQYFVYHIIKRYNYNVWLSALIYYCISTFYLASFNGMRQYIAIAIFIWAIKFIQQRSFVKYVISLVFAAFFFHTSVILFISVYFFINKELSFRQKAFILVLAFLFSSALDIIISYTPYMVYLARERETHINLFTYIFTFLSGILVVYWNKFSDFENSDIFSNMNYLCFISLIIVFLQSNGVMIQMMLRMNSYFLFIFILLVPAIISTIRNQSLRCSVHFFLHIILLGYLIRTIVLNGSMYDLVPYEFNFDLIK